MSDQNLFSEDNSNGSDPTPSSPNPFEDKLKEIKNENGEPKYKDLEAGLEALKHSQEFIKTLQSEKQQMADEQAKLKAELEKRESVEDVVKSLVSKPTQEVNTSTEEKPTGLDEGKVKELFQDLMSQNTQKQTENQNLSSVVKALQETHGDKAKDVISARAKELNTDPMQLEALARTNPTMALTLLNVAPSTSTAPAKPTQTSTHKPNHEKLSSVNTEKRLITGGPTREEVMGEWAAIKAEVYKNNDIQT